MANRQLSFTKLNLLQIYFRLSQLQVVGGRLAQIVALQKRLLATWPELAPGADAVTAEAVPAELKRETTFTAEEQSAVADGFVRLFNAGEISDLPNRSVLQKSS